MTLSPATRAIVSALKRIPKGKVASYGQIARWAGQPRGARQVARILHSLTERETLPWHRVVNRNGCISLPMDGGGGSQARLLRKEGLKVSSTGQVGLDFNGNIPFIIL